MKSSDFVVRRNDLQQCKFIEMSLPDALPDDALLIKIDRFAFTANNITYAVLGDALKYWQLFPAPENFGNIPVGGFGEVIASRHPEDQDGTHDNVDHRPETQVQMRRDKRQIRYQHPRQVRKVVNPVGNIHCRVGTDVA